MSAAPSVAVSLSELLSRARGEDAQETADLRAMQDWALVLEAPFSRHQPRAHFTGSAVVLDGVGGRVALLLHRKLNRWLQPGGHAEPQDGGDLELTALREAREETGLDLALHPDAPRPLDLDVHTIPARGDEPAHLHLDVRYLLVTHHPDALRGDEAESTALRWFSLPEALAQADEPALKRLLQKAARFLAPAGPGGAGG